MSDFGRSEEEREAARLEREQRRAQETEEFHLPDAHWDDEEPLGVRRVSRRERALGSAAPSTLERRRPAQRTARQPRGSRASRGPGDGARRRGGLLRWGLRVGALIPLIVVIAIVYAAVEIYQPFAGSPHGPKITVVVPPNAGAHQIGNLLAEKGIIASGFWFNLRTALDGDRSDLLSGTYHLQAGTTYAAAVKALKTAPPPVPTTTITMTPGERRITFAKRLRAIGVEGDYYTATKHSPLLDPTKYGAPASTPSLEGFMFPDTYQLRKPVKLSAFIADQLKRFKQEFATVDMSYAASKHLTPYDVLIIASLVQAEAFDAHDMTLVASTIYNRLHDGILLGFDSTTRYAVGNFTRPLTQSELASPSPWNTRNHAGLPPTPIDNPDMQAIRAAAHPPATNDLYFVSKPCSNALAFSSSYNQFLQNVAAFNATQSQNGSPPTRKCK